MTRSAAVLSRFHDNQPSDRMRHLSDGYRVAAEALTIAADLGCSGDIYDALTALMLREAGKVNAGLGLGEK